MHLSAGQRRAKGAYDTRAFGDPDAMPVVVVHGVKRSRLDLVRFAAVQFFHRAAAFEAIAGLKMVLLPKDHFEPCFQDAVGQGDTHTILGMQKAHGMPFVAVGLALGVEHILKGLDDHRPVSHIDFAD